MHRARGIVAGMVASVVVIGASSRIPTTVAAAEAEGAAFPRADVPSDSARVFAHRFSGTAERKCVAPRDSVAGGSLRSGEIIVRGSFLGPWSPLANRDQKFLWTPLHNPFAYPSAGGLVIRGALLGHAADTIRVTEEHPAYSARRDKLTDAGYPSLVRFPAAGDWLVVATSGKDWGCFVIHVAKRGT